MSQYGRAEDEWSALFAAGSGFLAERARMRRTTSYTELNAALTARTSSLGFDFGLDRDRAAMGALLGEIATSQLSTVGALVSSIVLYLNANDAGIGFYVLAKHLDLLPREASAFDRERFWSSQVSATFEHYSDRLRT